MADADFCLAGSPEEPTRRLRYASEARVAEEGSRRGCVVMEGPEGQWQGGR